MFGVFIFGLLVCSAFGAPQIRSRFLNVARLDGRIVGGEATTIQEYPYQVSVQLLSGHWCGGAIISAEYVLSAAHCFDYPQSWYNLRVGSSFHNSGGVIAQISSITRHPNYDWRELDNDIAVLRLSSSLSISDAVSPIALPSANQEVPAGLDSVVTGWGALTQGGPSPVQLQQVSVPIVSNADCAAAYQGYSVTSSMLCAGVPEGGRDACQGDSGGPLAIDGQLIGLVSWGIGCAQPNYPGVYASVPFLRDYISQTTGV